MFHRWISEEMTKIATEDLIEPEHEMREKDHPIGEMSDELKKLFTLWRKAHQETKEAYKKTAEAYKKIFFDFAAESKDDLENAMKESRALEGETSLAKQREDALRQAFWVSVRDEFPKAGDGTLAVCKGFKIVWLEEEEERVLKVAGVIISI